MIQCDCITWAEVNCREHLLGNGHNTACAHFKPGEGAVRLLKALIEGIHEWAAEGAAPDSLWNAVREATFATSGEFGRQAGGDAGCICRTCKKRPAAYLDQCTECRQTSTVAQDKEYLKPGGEWETKQRV